MMSTLTRVPEGRPAAMAEAVAPVLVARTPAGRKALRRRARKAGLRGPGGAALVGYPGSVAPVSADHGPVGGPVRAGLGRWARLGTTVTVVVVASVVAVTLAVGSGTRVVMVPVTVRPGDTLLTIARAAQPDADAATVEEDIRSANALSGDDLRVGEVLQVPSAR